MPLLARANAIARTLHWRRGLRAGFAVASAMLVCRALGRPMGWAALGGFEAVLVDNGGPYRSRANTIATVLFGGALCGIIGSLVPQQLSIAGLPPAGLLLAALITAAVCFLVTFARVAAQPIASTSVIILVLYFAGYGSSSRTLAGASANALAYILGGVWAAAISLFFWPVDPFRPARLEVAACYDLLADFTASLHAGSHAHAAHDDDHTHAVDFKRQLRARLESAHAALATTPARAPTRTHRARNLSVLLETADMLFAVTVRLTELAEVMSDDPGTALLPDPLEDIAHWLSGAERAIADGLKTRPADNAASFGPNGSHRLEYVTRRTALLGSRAPNATAQAQPGPVLAHLLADERDALQNVEIAFEALRAVWTGVDARLDNQLGPALRAVPGAASAAATAPVAATPPAWLDALRQNWTLNSIMMRHALRMAAVGAVDVLLMRLVRVNHGFWLAMTSIIVLQPHSTGTLRKGLERVGGTIAGGILAALLAAVIHSYTGIILVITACSILAIAAYAVDYGWYSFFLTPTFILLSLPYLRDWRYAGIRIVTTMLGAAVAVLAMRLLWPQSLTTELSGLLSRSAAAAACYTRAVLSFWNLPAASPPRARIAAERTLLAPARRACGLASQDAEEALDRALLDPGVPALVARNAAIETESALTFTTYIRRFTQCLTTLAAVGQPTPATVARLTSLIARLDAVAALLGREPSAASATPQTESSEPWRLDPEASHFNPAGDLAEQMLERMERQTGVLERAAAAMGAP